MMLTTRQLAQLMRISHRGMSKMVHNLNIPYLTKGNKYLYDLDSAYFPDFFQSIRISLINPHVKPAYSILDIANKLHKNKKTIYQLLIENDIKLYRNGRKYMVLLVDFERLKSRQSD